jgi:glycine/serine hydroxymethyltransferase
MSEIEQAIQKHRARNRELLELIASKGADPAVPRLGI